MNRFGLKFSVVTDVEDHSQLHSSKCGFCRACFLDSKMQICNLLHKDEQTKFSCWKCLSTSTFPDHRSLMKHIERDSHSRSPPRRQKRVYEYNYCKPCRKSYTTLNGFQRHFAKCHPQSVPAHQGQPEMILPDMIQQEMMHPEMIQQEMMQPEMVQEEMMQPEMVQPVVGFYHLDFLHYYNQVFLSPYLN